MNIIVVEISSPEDKPQVDRVFEAKGIPNYSPYTPCLPVPADILKTRLPLLLVLTDGKDIQSGQRAMDILWIPEYAAAFNQALGEAVKNA